MTTPARMTPPEVARLLRINPEKVIAWIRRGELRAVNVATNLSGRPRYIIDQQDLAVFEARRTAAPVKAIRRARNRVGEIKQFV